MIKKHSNKNSYLSTPDGLWVRDFTKKDVVGADLNELFSRKDYQVVVANEQENKRVKAAPFHMENLFFETVCIVGDGYDFDKKAEVLEKTSAKTGILAVNNVLNKWKLRRMIDYYVVNNPYPSIMNCFPRQLPRKKIPPIIASVRTNHQFMAEYPAQKYQYTPVPDRNLAVMQKTQLMIDDYRNPVCAALVLAYYMKARRVLLFCCDDCFADERAAAIKARGDLWMYPAHLTAQHVVDACCYWLKSKKVEVADHSSGTIYENAPYIDLNQVADYLSGDKE